MTDITNDDDDDDVMMIRQNVNLLNSSHNSKNVGNYSANTTVFDRHQGRV